MTSKVIAVIGPNQTRCTIDVYNFGIELGRRLADEGFTIINGGMFGFMEGVSKGARSSANYSHGKIIGVIPGDNKYEANSYCDIVIATGIGWARNQVIINSADYIVAVSGGAGTLSEIAYSWEAEKKIICYTELDGWSKELAGKELDFRNNTKLTAAASIDEIIQAIPH
ncbi:MAG: TIGR00725 family protein [Flavobacteriales bacterium]|nr:TIGR00725 family protein [Flavobacteriales bacterium]